jgi:hypothetical protein
MAKPALKKLREVFEARFDRGYRYLDRCGETMLILEDVLSATSKSIRMTDETKPTGARMKCPEMECVLVINSGQLILESSSPEEQPAYESIAQRAMETVVARFDLRELTRWGYRRTDLLIVDTMDGADQSALQVAKPTSWANLVEGVPLVDCDMVLRYEVPDKSSGYRIVTSSLVRFDAPIEIDERLKVPPHTLPKGQREALIAQVKRQQQRASDPQAGVSIDVDHFVLRPRDRSLSEFVGSSRVKAKELVAAIAKRASHGE